MPTASTLAPALGIFREKNFTAGSASSASVPPRKKGKNSGKSQRIPSQAAPKTQKRANVRRHGNRAKSFTSKNILEKGLHFGKSVVQ